MKLYSKDRIKQLLNKTFKEEKWKHNERSDQKAIVMDFIQLVIKDLDAIKQEKEQ